MGAPDEEFRASFARARGVQLFGHPRRQFFETPKPTPRTNATRRREYRRGGRRDRQRAPRRSRAVRGLNQHSRLTTSECWLRRPRSRSRSVVVSRAIMFCIPLIWYGSPIYHCALYRRLNATDLLWLFGVLQTTHSLT